MSLQFRAKDLLLSWEDYGSATRFRRRNPERLQECYGIATWKLEGLRADAAGAKC